MQIAHIAPESGASGDMLLGALVDAGADRVQLTKMLEGLGVDGWRLEFDEVTRGGLRALKATVHVEEDIVHRRWRDIRVLLESAELNDEVRSRALGTFGRLAEAEARVHSAAVDDVVFHEVGGLDAIVDIVGVCAALHLLRIERVSSSPVALGAGIAETRHGPLPVPVPAVLEILSGIPVTTGPAEGIELCTPTGAALLAEHIKSWEPLPPMTLTATGYGAGSRELATPNVLRVVVGESSVMLDPPAEPLILLEATIDDMAGEIVPVVLDAVRAAGARDVWARQIIMKKGRPGVEIVCLVEAEKAAVVRGALFRQSTTLGVREQVLSRWALRREHATVEVAGIRVRVKLGFLEGDVVNVAPEFEDCAAVAATTGLPVKTVVDLARAAWHGGHLP